MITLRAATTDEWPLLADLTKLANDEYAPLADADLWRNYEIATRTTVLTEPSAQRIVAQVGPEVVGSVLYCQPYEEQLGGRMVANPYPEMRLLSVHPQYRNKGIAGALIKACEAKAAAAQAGALTLHTTNLMTVAKAMYERRGYERYAAIDFEAAPGFVIYGYIRTLTKATD